MLFVLDVGVPCISIVRHSGSRCLDSCWLHSCGTGLMATTKANK